jgi:hypothetical protein
MAGTNLGRNFTGGMMSATLTVLKFTVAVGGGTVIALSLSHYFSLYSKPLPVRVAAYAAMFLASIMACLATISEVLTFIDMLHDAGSGKCNGWATGAFCAVARFAGHIGNILISLLGPLYVTIILIAWCLFGHWLTVPLYQRHHGGGDNISNLIFGGLITSLSLAPTLMLLLPYQGDGKGLGFLAWIPGILILGAIAARSCKIYLDYIFDKKSFSQYSLEDDFGNGFVLIRPPAIHCTISLMLGLAIGFSQAGAEAFQFVLYSLAAGFVLVFLLV